MNENLVKRLVNATLYEGYMLYPYRPSSIKNRKRFNFGVLAPREFAESEKNEKWQMQTECLIEGNEETNLNIKISFLQLVERKIGKLENFSGVWNEKNPPDFEIVSSLEIEGKIFQPWEEAVEREIELKDLKIEKLLNASQTQIFSFSKEEKSKPLRDENEKIIGANVFDQKEISGRIEIKAEKLNAQNLYKLTIRCFNTTSPENLRDKTREGVLLYSFISAHTILSAESGEFISLLDPPEKFKSFAESSENIGTYPILVGENGDEKDCVLSSPIILYDYPEIAPESKGDLFDGLEIDEILTLRIMTMTDDEKREMRGADEKTRKILERTENLANEELLKLHGTMRGLRESLKR